MERSGSLLEESTLQTFPLSSFKLGSQSATGSLAAVHVSHSLNKLIFFVDNSPWSSVFPRSRSAHLLNLMISKSLQRHSPFANRSRMARLSQELSLLEEEEFRKASASPRPPGQRTSKSHGPRIGHSGKRVKWQTVETLVRRLQAKKKAISRIRPPPRGLCGCVTFEVEWKSVQGISYRNVLQEDTLMALEAAIIVKREFDSVDQAKRWHTQQLLMAALEQRSHVAEPAEPLDHSTGAAHQQRASAMSGGTQEQSHWPHPTGAFAVGPATRAVSGARDMEGNLRPALQLETQSVNVVGTPRGGSEGGDSREEEWHASGVPGESEWSSGSNASSEMWTIDEEGEGQEDEEEGPSLERKAWALGGEGEEATRAEGARLEQRIGTHDGAELKSKACDRLDGDWGKRADKQIGVTEECGLTAEHGANDGRMGEETGQGPGRLSIQHEGHGSKGRNPVFSATEPESPRTMRAPGCSVDGPLLAARSLREMASCIEQVGGGDASRKVCHSPASSGNSRIEAWLLGSPGVCPLYEPSLNDNAVYLATGGASLGGAYGAQTSQIIEHGTMDRLNEAPPLDLIEDLLDPRLLGPGCTEAAPRIEPGTMGMAKEDLSGRWLLGSRAEAAPGIEHGNVESLTRDPAGLWPSVSQASLEGTPAEARHACHLSRSMPALPKDDMALQAWRQGEGQSQWGSEDDTSLPGCDVSDKKQGSREPTLNDTNADLDANCADECQAGVQPPAVTLLAASLSGVSQVSMKTCQQATPRALTRMHPSFSAPRMHPSMSSPGLHDGSLSAGHLRTPLGISHLEPSRTVYVNRLVTFCFMDLTLPFKLKTAVLKDQRLLQLVEAGLPPWAILWQTCPGVCRVYRPWMKSAALYAYVIISLITALIGLYDLYKNVPVLRETLARALEPLLRALGSLDMATRLKYLGTIVFLQNCQRAFGYLVGLGVFLGHSFSWVYRLLHPLLSPLLSPFLLLSSLLASLGSGIALLVSGSARALASGLWALLISLATISQALGRVLVLALSPLVYVGGTAAATGLLLLQPFIRLGQAIGVGAAFLLSACLRPLVQAVLVLVAFANSVLLLLSRALAPLRQLLPQAKAIQGAIKSASSGAAATAASSRATRRMLGTPWDVVLIPASARLLLTQLFQKVFRSLRGIVEGIRAFVDPCIRHRASLYQRAVRHCRRLKLGMQQRVLTPARGAARKLRRRLFHSSSTHEPPPDPQEHNGVSGAAPTSPEAGPVHSLGLEGGLRKRIVGSVPAGSTPLRLGDCTLVPLVYQDAERSAGSWGVYQGCAGSGAGPMSPEAAPVKSLSLEGGLRQRHAERSAGSWGVPGVYPAPVGCTEGGPGLGQDSQGPFSPEGSLRGQRYLGPYSPVLGHSQSLTWAQGPGPVGPTSLVSSVQQVALLAALQTGAYSPRPQDDSPRQHGGETWADAVPGGGTLLGMSPVLLGTVQGQPVRFAVQPGSGTIQPGGDAGVEVGLGNRRSAAVHPEPCDEFQDPCFDSSAASSQAARGQAGSADEAHGSHVVTTGASMLAANNGTLTVRALNAGTLHAGPGTGEAGAGAAFGAGNGKAEAGHPAVMGGCAVSDCDSTLLVPECH